MPENLYLELRSAALNFKPASTDSNTFFGVVSDISMGDAIVTVITLSDGTASMYYSSGGGMIGGDSHNHIQSSVQAVIQIVNEHKIDTALRETSQHPLPRDKEVIFHLLSKDGVSGISASIPELLEGKHALSPLFFAVNNVISEFSTMIEGENNQQK